jgi:thiosulfate dehydrogenase (quinone) large subunit
MNANDSTLERPMILFFRLAMGWTFLYAGARQLLDPGWSAAGFLGHTKTFHDFFAVFAAPGVVPYTDFLVKWGHFLIGLSLVSGLLVRVSGIFGILLLGTYYFAHMDFPYIEAKVNMIVDYHLVYIGVITYLIAKRAGRVWGLDGWLETSAIAERVPALRPLVG